MGAMRRIADGLIGLSAVIGSVGLFIEVAIILVDVIGRAFGHPLYGAQDIITMTQVIVVFGGMALCDRKGGHIAVDILERHLPFWMNRAVDVLAALLGAVIFAGIAHAILDSARISVMLNLNTNLLNLPKAWFQWALAGFSAITALGLLLRALELTFTGRDVRREQKSAS